MHEVAKNRRREKLAVFQLGDHLRREDLRDRVHEKRPKPILVLLVHQSIVEDAEALVLP